MWRDCIVYYSIAAWKAACSACCVANQGVHERGAALPVLLSLLLQQEHVAGRNPQPQQRFSLRRGRGRSFSGCGLVPRWRSTLTRQGATFGIPHTIGVGSTGEHLKTASPGTRPYTQKFRDPIVGELNEMMAERPCTEQAMSLHNIQKAGVSRPCP